MAISVFPIPTQAIAEPVSVEGPDTEGASAQGSLFTVAGQELGANTTRVLTTDSSGRQIAVGAVSTGSAVGTSNPVMIGGSDGTSVRRVLLDANGAIIAVGSVAHDSPDGGSPLKIGGKANASAPSDVSADNDRVDAWFDRAGRLVVNPFIPGTLANGAETAVSSAAVQILGANTSRKKLIVQNVGANAVRVGASGVTATTGFRLDAGQIAVFDMPHCPTSAIFAIRQSADSTVLAQEVT